MSVPFADLGLNQAQINSNYTYKQIKINSDNIDIINNELDALIFSDPATDKLVVTPQENPPGGLGDSVAIFGNAVTVQDNSTEVIAIGQNITVNGPSSKQVVIAPSLPAVGFESLVQLSTRGVCIGDDTEVVASNDVVNIGSSAEVDQSDRVVSLGKSARSNSSDDTVNIGNGALTISSDKVVNVGAVSEVNESNETTSVGYRNLIGSPADPCPRNAVYGFQNVVGNLATNNLVAGEGNFVVRSAECVNLGKDNQIGDIGDICSYNIAIGTRADCRLASLGCINVAPNQAGQSNVFRNSLQSISMGNDNDMLDSDFGIQIGAVSNVENSDGAVKVGANGDIANSNFVSALGPGIDVTDSDNSTIVGGFNIITNSANGTLVGNNNTLNASTPVLSVGSGCSYTLGSNNNINIGDNVTMATATNNIRVGNSLTVEDDVNNSIILSHKPFTGATKPASGSIVFGGGANDASQLPKLQFLSVDLETLKNDVGAGLAYTPYNPVAPVPFVLPFNATEPTGQTVADGWLRMRYQNANIRIPFYVDTDTPLAP